MEYVTLINNDEYEVAHCHGVLCENLAIIRQKETKAIYFNATYLAKLFNKKSTSWQKTVQAKSLFAHEECFTGPTHFNVSFSDNPGSDLQTPLSEEVFDGTYFNLYLIGPFALWISVELFMTCTYLFGDLINKPWTKALKPLGKKKPSAIIVTFTRDTKVSKIPKETKDTKDTKDINNIKDKSSESEGKVKSTTSDSIDYTKLTCIQLKEICKKKDITITSRMTKDQIIAALLK